MNQNKNTCDKLCVIYNMAAKYRAPIFRLMDREMNIDWYYGHQMGDIQEMDSSEISSVTRLKRINLLGPLSWQRNVIPLLFRKEYTKYIMTGELFSVSTWAILLLKHIFTPQKKIYLWSHGWYGREGRFKRVLKRCFFGMADATMLYGNYAKEVAEEQGNNPNKLIVIYNSLDFEAQSKLRLSLAQTDVFKRHFGNQDPVIIFVGRLTHVKHLDMLINAINILISRNVNVNLMLIGNGEASESLVRLVKESGLSERVWFYGSCYDDTIIADFIYNSDVCVAPGNVGLTAMHSMAFGTPVISHDNFSKQMPEFEAIKKGETGDFFKYGSIESLAETIEKWLKEKRNREQVRQSCIAEIAKNWSPKSQFDRISALIYKFK